MKNHELLELIGDVNEDYVQEAGNNVVKPRFGWRKLAACAACAALLLGASYPAYMAAHPPLHSYTVLEGGGMTTLDDVKAPAGGESDPNAIPGGAYVGRDKGETGIDGTEYTVPGQDAPADEAAAAQYSKLLQGMGGVDGLEPAAYPDWFAGAWLEQGALAVAIVDGFRTPELEARIEEWCGGVTFRDVKYSYPHLNSLMEQTVALLDGTGLSCGIGVDVTANCLGVDLYSNGQTIPDSILAELAKLDPDGGAIRVRLFTGKLDALTDDMVKGPAPVDPEARATPSTTVDDGKTVYHGEDAPADSVPGGATRPQDGTQKGGETEEGQLAHYDLLPLSE